MKRFSFVMLAVAAAVCAVCWLGCGGGDNGNPADNSGNNNGNGGDANHDGKLICGNGEAWAEVHEGYSCASPKNGNIGIELKSNSAYDLKYDDGVWKRHPDNSPWRTNGNKLIISNPSGEKSISTNYLTAL